mmetsp:Transcript_1837/g.4825  ORF Transcript_1837/g.4825 Transcript_1837/m.4825 type:complete len:211 (-) Transcript_1837:1416-2048(-)
MVRQTQDGLHHPRWRPVLSEGSPFGGLRRRSKVAHQGLRRKNKRGSQLSPSPGRTSRGGCRSQASRTGRGERVGGDISPAAQADTTGADDPKPGGRIVPVAIPNRAVQQAGGAIGIANHSRPGTKPRRLPIRHCSPERRDRDGTHIESLRGGEIRSQRTETGAGRSARQDCGSARCCRRASRRTDPIGIFPGKQSLQATDGAHAGQQHAR